MTLVQGELKLVTDAPDEVSQVWIQAPKERLHGTGMITDGRASEQVKNGVVSFNALPGAAVMVLLVNGIPSLTKKLLVPDKANATLRECIEAVGLADDGTLSELESLSLEVARIAAQIASADRLESWASETASAAAQAQLSKNEAGLASNHATAAASNARQSESNAKQSEANAKQSEVNAGASASSASASEAKSKEYRDSAATVASTAVDSARTELGNIVSDASDYAAESATSAAQAKTSETNAKTHEANSLSAAERAEFAAEETIQQVEGDFATRNYADSKDWHKGPITTEHQTMADVGVGAWNVAARNLAVQLGLPMDFGSLQVMRIGNSNTAFFIGQTTGMWINTSSGATWGEWRQISESSKSNIQGGGGGGTTGLKTVAMAVTAGSVLDGVAGRYRVLTQVTAPVARWRIHVESRRLVYSTTSAFTLGNVYVGKHAGNGVITGQQQIKSGSSTVAAGDEWVSPWMDASLLSDETLIDLDVTGSGLFSSQATSWVYKNGSWVSSKNTPVSIWVELETFDQVPVVGMIGDSTGCGQGADRPVFDSALYIAARKDGFIPMSYAYPGSSMQSMNNYDLHIFQRWAHLDKPDSVIIQSGSNDIHAGTSASELQTRFVDLMETAEKISPVVIGATVKARYPNSGDHQATLNAHNAFVKTRANGNRDYVDFYQAVSPSGTVASADAADGAHLSTSGHQKLATAFDSVTVSRSAWVDTAKELDAKADQSVITAATHEVGRADAARANRLVKLDENGDLFIATNSIIKDSDPVNKVYVDRVAPIPAFAGTGSPEGRVTSPVGTIYTDTSATNGAIRWIKTSGTGNTGWRVEYGDTGWRDISSLITNGWVGSVYVRRINAAVELRAEGLTRSATSTNIMTLPAGFLPDMVAGFGFRFTLHQADSTASQTRFRTIANMLTTVNTSSVPGPYYGGSMWNTSEAWPTTLPGTPA